MAWSYDDLTALGDDAKRQIIEQTGGKKMPKPSKYRNVKTVVDGVTFDSAKEARRYTELMLLLRTEQIRNLRLQPEYTLIEQYRKPENGELVRAMRYRADFSYERRTVDAWGYERWLPTVEDVKGMKTSEYKLKRKQFRDKYGFDITEV